MLNFIIFPHLILYILFSVFVLENGIQLMDHIEIGKEFKSESLAITSYAKDKTIKISSK